jgi:hypothetical protein
VHPANVPAAFGRGVAAVARCLGFGVASGGAVSLVHGVCIICQIFSKSTAICRFLQCLQVIKTVNASTNRAKSTDSILSI